MKRIGLLLACIGALLPVLAGCGSGSSPPFSLSCKLHRLPGGFVRANVTVTNSTGAVRNAVIYGPPFDRIRHIYPPQILRPTAVAVHLPQQVATYAGLLVLHVKPNSPAHLILRFLPPPRPQSIAVADTRTVQADDLHVLDNPDCVVKRVR